METAPASQASVPLTPFEILELKIIKRMVMGDPVFQTQGNVEKLFRSHRLYSKNCPVSDGIDTVEQPQSMLDAHSSIHSFLFDKVIGHRDQQGLSHQGCAENCEWTFCFNQMKANEQLDFQFLAILYQGQRRTSCSLSEFFNLRQVFMNQAFVLPHKFRQFVNRLTQRSHDAAQEK